MTRAEAHLFAAALARVEACELYYAESGRHEERMAEVDRLELLALRHDEVAEAEGLDTPEKRNEAWERFLTPPE